MTYSMLKGPHNSPISKSSISISPECEPSQLGECSLHLEPRLCYLRFCIIVNDDEGREPKPEC